MKLPPGYVPGSTHKATAFGGIGERLLKQFGWKEGQGLGAEGTGITSALKVAKKEDTIGLGGREKLREEAKNWWEEAYNSAAQTLPQGEMTPDSDDSDDDNPNTPTLMRNRDGTIASGTKDELRIARQLAKDPWGRFGGRNGKLARIRQQEAAMAAALAASNGDGQAHAELRSQAGPGRSRDNAPASKRRKTQDTQQQPQQNVAPLDQGFQQAAPKLRKKTQKAVQNRSQSAVPCATNGTHPADLGNSKRPQKKARKAELAEDSSLQPTRNGNGICSEQLQQQMQRPAIRVERVAQPSQMTGLEKTQQIHSSERRAFTEDTQANLYNRTQAAKTAGKQGLGIGQGKAADHQWRGTRIVIEEEERGEEGEKEEKGEGRASCEKEARRMKKKLLKKASKLAQAAT